MTNIEKKLQITLDSIKKEHGKGSIFLATDEAMPGVEFVSTQSLGLDQATGGGLARGRIIEIWGAESSGKTTLMLHALAEQQKQGIRCAFIDAEHALDIKYAKALGVDTENLLISQPDNGEQALNITELLVRGDAVKFIVVDSVAALVPRAEVEGNVGDTHMGLQARMMSQALRKLTAITASSNCTIVFINQTRMKIGIVYGNPVTTSGGNALKFYASQRFEIKRVTSNKVDGEIVSNRVRVTVKKSKVFPPFGEAEFDIKFGIGIDRTAEMFDLAVDMGLIDKSGSWYAYGEDKIGQGKTKTFAWLEERPEIFEKIKGQVRAQLGL